MRLILHDLEPLHWAVAGLGIAGVTLALLFLANNRLGLSTGFEGMFLFTEFQLYRILAVAVGVGAPGIWLIKKRGRTVLGRRVSIELKPLHRGNVAGGVLFGMG
jgi:hypothetical protein